MQKTSVEPIILTKKPNKKIGIAGLEITGKVLALVQKRGRPKL
jgi:hypothetical protein